ncbi:MAG TPA: response regulator [Gammaproteobacteria bacterium]|nr:response regulator [Gammaproteobacteria bacterium]
MIRVLLVDDHELVRTAFKLMLNDAQDFEIIGEAENGEDAIRLTRELSPDVIIMDLNMPGIGGFEAIARLLRSNPLTKILIVSARVDGLIPARLIEMGVAGYLSKQASAEQMLVAIRTVYEGGRYIDATMAENIAMFHIAPAENASPFAHLSERELQVLLMVADGMETDEIADKLCLSKKTINGYQCNLLKKLKAKTDVEAVRIAIEHGMVEI